MRRTLSLLGTGLQQAALIIGLGLSQGLAATVTFTNTPGAVSNSYTGFITLQIGGLNSNETVVVQEFLDLNANGVIDGGDWLVQQFQLTDGQPGMVIGGIVNSNVPGDTTATNGAITAQLPFNNGSVVQTFGGAYLFKLSSPTGRFTPITNTFAVTNLPYPQGFTGSVICSGTNVPNAIVMLFQGQVFKSSALAAAVADNFGNYSLQAPPGTYSLGALKNNYLVNTVTAPVLTLGDTSIQTNLSLIAATNSVSGEVVDAVNPSFGLPGILVTSGSSSGPAMVGLTDTNGNFSLGVTSGQWHLRADDLSLVVHGYVGLQDKTNVNAGQTGIALAVPKATALFYGSVKDSLGNPLVGIDVYAWDNNSEYETDGYSDANGSYCAGVLGGLSNDPWQVQVSTDSGGSATNYVFSGPSFNQNGGTNLAASQAVECNFVGLLATNQIAGYVKDGSGNPITNVNVWAQATIAGTSFNGNMNTDATGHYAINVGNGVWQVGVCCGGGGNCLGSQYLCPNGQTVAIANNNTNVNFTALLAPSQISGYVKDTSNNPISNVWVYAYLPGSGNGTGSGATTDSSGYYSFSVANGSWNVGLSCCGNQSLSPLGYLCVGEQSTTVSNSTGVVNFSVPHAPYQITGYLRDASGNPIPNVGVSGGNGSNNACATTASDGSYTLNVSNGDWFVSVDCNALGSFTPPYLCPNPNGQSVTVSNASAQLNFSAIQAPYQITGWVKNNSSQPLTNVDVTAGATIGTNSYWLDVWPDANGNYSFPVANGQWTVAIDCGALDSTLYLCPSNSPATINIAGASVATNFTIQVCGPLQIVTASLPSGQMGTTNYDFFLQAMSCNPSFAWSLRSGSLPPGLRLASTGELYGAPGTNGTWDFTVQVTDGNYNSTNQALSLTILPAPVDVFDYYVMKMESFVQLASTNVVPDTNHGPFTAIFAIVQSALDTVPIANVELPSGVVYGFPPGSSGLELEFYYSYATQAALDAACTNGNYIFELATVHDGFQFPVLALPAAAYPTNPPPQVSNFAAAQAINPLSPFTLQWSNPSGATTNDWIWIFINDTTGNTVFSTPKPSMNPWAALTGTTTSVVVPTNTFQPGAAYTGIITFIRNTSVNTAAYPGAVGGTFASVRTRFSMAAPSSLPVLSQPARISASQFGFLLSGAAGQTYTVLVTTNAALPLADWSTVLTTNLSGSSAAIQDNQATNQRRFYRAKVGP
jgi:hypothetical protein